jgi:hypothetical protein
MPSRAKVNYTGSMAYPNAMASDSLTMSYQWPVGPIDTVAYVTCATRLIIRRILRKID